MDCIGSSKVKSDYCKMTNILGILNELIIKNIFTKQSLACVNKILHVSKQPS